MKNNITILTIFLIITLFSIKILPGQSNIKITKIMPLKYLTPNGDGINDEISFVIENPKESIISGCIYDITGAFVSDFQWQGDNSLLKWDGKGLNGTIVREGIYIYKIKAEDKEINGTIVVLK